MPKDPYIHEKYTKERTAARRLAAEYFQRFPKDSYQTEIESWREQARPPPTAPPFAASKTGAFGMEQCRLSGI
jgi:hypothetical protein